MVVLSLAVMTLRLLSPAADAQTVISYPSGFASQPSQLWLENASKYSGSSIQITAAIGHTANNVWFKTPVNEQAFTTTFTFHFNCSASSDCGDGMGFMMICQCSENPTYLNPPNDPGYTYSGFSSQNFSWSNCDPSNTPECSPLIKGILVKFDLYNDQTGEPGAETTGYYTGGEIPQYPNPQYDMSGSGINMQSGDEFTCTLTYDGSNLTETLTDTVTKTQYTHTYTGVNIPAAIGANTAFVGFGGGTGAAVVDTYLDSWTYSAQSPGQTAVPTLSAAAPAFSPAAGTYSRAQGVTLSTASSGAVICYNTTGSPATNGSGGCANGKLYTGPVTVSSNETLYAVAGGTEYNDSSVGNAKYVIQNSVSTPTLLPGSGTYSSAQSVTLSDATSDATIYYTTDGTTPTTSSTKYTGPITVSSTETLEAIAVAAGDTNSAVASAAYTITLSSPGAGNSQVVIDYPSGFASQPSQLWLENASVYSGSSIKLTSSNGNLANNAWYKTPVNVQAFTTTFTWTASCPAKPARCGDGMGFMIISKSNPSSAGFTYSGFSGAQISWSKCSGPPGATTDCPSIKSVLVKFDLYNNSTNTDGANLTGFYSDGVYPHETAEPPQPEYNMAPSDISMQSGHLMKATLTYTGTTLMETVTDTVTGATYRNSYSADIPSLVGGNTAYVGFGGSTGAATVTQDLSSWTYTVE